MVIKEEGIQKFLDSLASASPTPGGGTAAALVAATAASLVEMVANLTISKKGYEKVSSRMKKISREAKNYRVKLLQLADEDSLAFEKVMSLYKSNDSGRLQEALKKATEIPLLTLKISTEIGKLSKEVALKGNKNANSDAKSALYLSQAAKKSAMENVLINLKSIQDKKWKDKIIADCQYC